MVPDLKAATLTILLLVAGCSGGVNQVRSTESAQNEGTPSQATGTSSAEPPVAGSPDVRLPLLPPGGDSAQVGAIGVLQVDGPCLYLRAPNGSLTLPVFATEQTRWNRSAGLLEVGDRTFRPGQTVTLGGTPADSPPSGAAWIQAPDSSCNAARVFITHSIEAGG